MNKMVIRNKIIQYCYIALGVILLDLGFYFFLSPANLVLGGTMGLAILLEPYYSAIGPWFTNSIFLFIANTTALIIGGILLGRDFFFKTIFSTFFSPFVIFIFEISNVDPMFFLKEVSVSGYYWISLICGCILSGLGLGIALKNNGSTGGMDVLQKCMSKYLHIPYSKTMYFTDWVIVLLSGLALQNGFAYRIEFVVYGIIGVFTISKIIDTIVLNARRRRTAYIITKKPEEIKQCIYEKINRGVTFVDAKGGYTNESKTLVICTMEKTEAYRIMELLRNVDPGAFCFITSTREIIGEY